MQYLAKSNVSNDNRNYVAYCLKFFIDNNGETMVQKIIVLLPVIFLAAFAACTQQPDVSTMSEEELTAYARGIHDRVLTIDTHDDIPLNFATEEVDPADPDSDRQVTLPQMREGGLDAGFFIVYVGQGERTPEAYKNAYDEAITKFKSIHRFTEEMYPGQIELAYTPEDVRRIHASGKLVACIGIENGYPIGDDLSILEEFYEMGGRYITLAHFGHNQICDSSVPRGTEPLSEHNGVSEFGKQVITAMNRLGIMVDVSHISKKSMLDAVSFSKAPVIFSHSGIGALNDHPRNADDEMLLALRENGGVIQCVALEEFVKTPVGTPDREAAVIALRAEYGITATDNFGIIRQQQELSEEKQAEYTEKLAELNEEYDVPRVNLKDYVDHIDYAVNLIGIDHVAISSDFDGGGGVEGWDDASETFNVTLELVRRGYSGEDIEKLWGENTLRVWSKVERVSWDIR
jgi:membrane dipeptidase